MNRIVSLSALGPNEWARYIEDSIVRPLVDVNIGLKTSRRQVLHRTEINISPFEAILSVIASRD